MYAQIYRAQLESLSKRFRWDALSFGFSPDIASRRSPAHNGFLEYLSPQHHNPQTAFIWIARERGYNVGLTALLSVYWGQDLRGYN